MRRFGCIVSLVAVALTACSEDDVASNFRVEACALAEAKPSSAAERDAIGKRASALLEPMTSRRIPRETADILSLVTLLPALARVPEGASTLPPAELPLPGGSRPWPNDMNEALAAIRDECGSA